MVKRFDNIHFRFLSADDDSVLKGTVLVRDDNMILEIQDPNGASPYLIIGTPRKHFFEGNNQGVQGEHNPVEAKWAELDGIYLGLWVEDSYDYFFSFQLPRNAML